LGSEGWAKDMSFGEGAVSEINSSNICLKTTNELLTNQQGEPSAFWIPAYQRGYRWAPLQVTQLLDDIREFNRRRNPQPDEFYCLQPLVIKITEHGKFEVVDGQQRLTTILLILRHFNERLAENYRQKLFNLDYETRPDLLNFLNEPTEERAESNVDYFHLYEAIHSIEEWFGDKENEVDEIKTALLNKTKVIWFQLSEGDNPVDAFTRLNVGKIPLTNDELIRALFLKRDMIEDKDAENLQLRIAYEWDLLEKELQNDSFWYFLSNQPGKKQNRIGFLFELIARAEENAEGLGRDELAVFYAYNKKLKEEKLDPESEWLKIKQVFMMLEEWFEDRALYHIVGFLIQQGIEIEKLRAMAEDISKSEFERNLRAEAYNKIGGGRNLFELSEDQLSERLSEIVDGLDYGRNSTQIRSILFLFNLATLLEDERSNIRFQFDSFKREEWDIEHVRSVASNPPERHHDQVEWMRLCLGYLKSQDEAAKLRSEIEKFCAMTQKEASDADFDFEALYEKVLKEFKEDSDEGVDNGVSNLTLLDSSTNRSYKNAVFAVKRQRLLSLDKSGIFVPLCTRNVFLKCYSPKVDNVMFWSKKDRDAYRSVIICTLTRFFMEKGGASL